MALGPGPRARTRARVAAELATISGLYTALHAMGLTGPLAPGWILADTAAVAALTWALFTWAPPGSSPVRRSIRTAGHVAGFTTLLAVTGWGPALVGALAFIVADALRADGPSQTLSAFAWACAAVAAQQVGVLAGVVPSVLPEAQAHAVAGLGLLGLALTTSRLRRMALDTRRAQQAELAAHERFRGLVHNARDVILTVQSSTEVSYASPAVTSAFGFQPDELVGTPLLTLVPPTQRDAVQRAITGSAPEDELEFRLRHADGTWRHVEAVRTDLRHVASVAGVVLNVRDITQRRQLEARLEHQAFHDELTGLPNRALFLDRVEHAVATMRRRDQPLAVMLVDLNGFKAVNDSLGHPGGDALLGVISQRLASQARQTDTVARLGGDEFAVLIEDLDDDDAAARAAERLAAAVRQPVTLEETTVSVSATVGLTVADTPQADVEQLLRDADVAMYTAKRAGRDYELFDPSMHAEIVRRLRLERDLQTALERGQLELHYQPIVRLADGHVAGVEALLRWHHPERGDVPPDEFVPVAEETGLIVPIGRWVLQQACRQLAEWRRDYPEASDLVMSVNVAARQLADDRLVDDVLAALRHAGLAASALTIEVTETALIAETQAASQRLTELHDAGVGVALDDFGTGYSSLSHLRNFPVNTLKIDRSLLGADGGAPQMVQAMVDLSQSLALHTVVEGLETDEQLDRFRTLACDDAQGYLLGRPGDAVTTEALLLNGSVTVDQGAAASQTASPPKDSRFT